MNPSPAIGNGRVIALYLFFCVHTMMTKTIGIYQRCVHHLSRRLTSRWFLNSLKTSTVNGYSRVSAKVAGHEVWFESKDIHLRATPEGFLSAFLLPAMHCGATLHCREPLDKLWLNNSERLSAIFSSWWSYRSCNPIKARRTRVERCPTGCLRALFFTGGVDSFYSLFHGPPVDFLIYVHGYDIPLADVDRLSAFEVAFNKTAAATNSKAIVVRTNLREHPFFAPIDWVVTHGHALAAVSHFLPPEVGKAGIASSDSLMHPGPWGSHEETDPLFSSSAMKIEHLDAALFRDDKLRAIAPHQLVQESLRVCWENRVPLGNCSCCEKCLRTMVVLKAFGFLDQFTVFDASPQWEERLKKLSPMNGKAIIIYWLRMVNYPLPEPILSQVHRLLGR